MATGENGKEAQAKVDSYVERTLAGHIFGDIGIVDFIQTVYAYTPDKLPNASFQLEGELCTNFEKIKSEIDSYRPLAAIFDDLKKQIFASSTGTGARVLEPMRHRFTASDHETFKPDFIVRAQADHTQVREKYKLVSWSEVLAYGKVKREPNYWQNSSIKWICDLQKLSDVSHECCFHQID